MSRSLARVVLVLGSVVATLGMSACGGSSKAAGSTPAEVRLGYFPNLTHATAIVADKEGFFTRHLGVTQLKVSTFNAGPAAIEALKSGAIDATYVGPSPATNAYINSDGQALTVVAGAATGGTSFVVDHSIMKAADLKGKKVAGVDGNPPHAENFIQCLRSREKPICDVEIAHDSTNTCHLGNIAYKVGRKLTWDAATESFPNDAEANAHLSREPRKGYELPKI